jgi:hypothetical protein
MFRIPLRIHAWCIDVPAKVRPRIAPEAALHPPAQVRRRAPVDVAREHAEALPAIIHTVSAQLLRVYMR